MASAPNVKNEQIIGEIIRCSNFAAIKHKDQRRKSPDLAPYINHPIGVAHILCNEGNIQDLEVIQAALLHDTVEDTDTTLPELEQEFGAAVAKIVDEVTDDKSLGKQERKNAQIVKAPTTSHRAKLVKLADKLYNLRDLEKATPVGWSPERVQEYFEWALKVIEGLRGTNAALEAALDEVFSRRGITK